MTTYSYIARTAAGERVEGTLSGASEQSVVSELQARALAPVRVRAVRERTSWSRRVGTRRLAGVYRQLGDLLRAGVPLLRALRLLARSRSHPALAEVMGKVADEVADGGRFADAMAAHPRVFPPVQVAMIRAGERGGFLDQVLTRMGSFLEHQADLRGRVVGSLIYPLVLLVFALIIVGVALVFIVPKFETFFSRMELPLPTRILFGASAVLHDHGLLLAMGAVAAVAGLLWLRGRPGVRRALAAWQLRVPALGPFVRALAVARFCRMLGTLLANGVPLLAAMQISRDAAGHPLLVEAIAEAMESVRAGETLAEPLSSSGLFGDDVIEMISVGESANNLAEVLVTVAETIEKRIDRLLAVLLRLLEPAFLLAIAGIVVFIFIALVVPMLRLSASI